MIGGGISTWSQIQNLIFELSFEIPVSIFAGKYFCQRMINSMNPIISSARHMPTRPSPNPHSNPCALITSIINVQSHGHVARVRRFECLPSIPFSIHSNWRFSTLRAPPSSLSDSSPTPKKYRFVRPLQKVEYSTNFESRGRPVF